MSQSKKMNLIQANTVYAASSVLQPKCKVKRIEISFG